MAVVIGANVIGTVLYLEITGDETYILPEEMLDYLTRYRLSTDPLRIQWEAMKPEDQEVLLHRAYAQINSLPYKGRPKDSSQEEPFPRDGNFTPKDLLKVKYAQAEQALAISDTVTAQETEDRLRLRRAGVVQYSIGDLSERFQTGMSSVSCGNFYGLSESAYKYLSKWLQGGYNICSSIKRPSGRL